ncbi:hypothetical protein D9M71_515880 [compost metagenome]
MRAGTDENEVTGRIGAWVDGIPRSLECQEQLLSFLRSDGVLDLIDDQHDVGLGLVDHFGQCLSQRWAIFLADAVHREAELEAKCLDIQTADTLEPIQQGRGGSLKLLECLADGGMQQLARTGRRVAPQVDVDDQRAGLLQSRDEVVGRHGLILLK